MKPKAIVCDLDGTIAHRGRRDPYDMTRVGADTLDDAVAIIIRALNMAGLAIVFTTGRDETARYSSAKWVEEQVGITGFDLLMRDHGDGRADAVIKKEMLDIIVHFYDIVVAFDDRNQVVDMWRTNGVKCFQVCSREQGDF